MLKNCPNFRLKYAYGMLKKHFLIFKFFVEVDFIRHKTNNIFDIIDNYLLEV